MRDGKESGAFAVGRGRVRYLIDLTILTGAEVVGTGLRFAVIISIRAFDGLQLSGVYIYGMALGIIFSIIADAGQMQFMTRALSYDPTEYESSFGPAFFIRVYGNLVLVGLYALYGILTPDLDKLNIVICCMVTAGVLGLIETTEGVWLALGKPEKAARMRVGAMTAIFAVPLLFYLLGFVNIELLVLMQATLSIITIGIYYKKITFEYGKTDRTVSRRFLRHLRGSWVLGLNQLFIVIFVQAPVVMIRWLLDTTSVGIYGIIQRVVGIAEIIMINFFKLTFPRFSKSFSGVNNSSEVWKTVWVLTGIFIFLAASGAAVLMLTAPWISRVFLGSYLPQAITVITIAAMAMGFSLVKRPLFIALLASKQEKLVSFINGLSLIIVVFGTYIVLPVNGITGAAIVWLTAEVFCFVIMSLAGLRIYKSAVCSEKKSIP